MWRGNGHGDTVRLGLESLVRHAAYQRLAPLREPSPTRRTCQDVANPPVLVENNLMVLIEFSVGHRIPN